MTDIKWIIERIRKMPVAEYGYRLNQIRKKRADRSAFKRGRDNVISWDDHRITILNKDISGMGRLFPDIQAQAVEEAEKILAHRFDIFGIEADFGDPVNWHLDPKTGRSWPLDFWGDIDYRDGTTVGGIKFAWELNRLNHLPKLAVAFALAKESRFKKEIFSELESWLVSNPYPRGINWIMGIELAIRIVNVVYALRFLGTDILTKREREIVLAFIGGHARHLDRYPSKYSSAANHAVAEALGLYFAGSFFPGFSEAQKWRERGRRILIEQVDRQIYADGGSFEHSIPYLQLVLDQVLLFILAGRETSDDAQNAVENKLRSSLDFLARVHDRRGHFPAVGDGDDGYFLKLWFGSHNNILSLLNTGAVLFDNAEWISESAVFDHKTAFLLGDGAGAAWEKLKSGRRGGIRSSDYFPQSGIAVMRNERSPEILIVGNSGALGARPLGAHGHADALSLWMSVEGQPILIDPGTYLFHGGASWRNYFRSTAAHNTIRVDSADQAEILSDFMYRTFYSILDARLDEVEDRIIWSAGHDGYSRLKDPVVHWRKVAFDKRTHGIRVEDAISCRGSHSVESRFHFHPDCSIEGAGPRYWIRKGNVNVDFVMDQKWDRIEVIKGNDHLPAGWYSPAFNVLQECPSLVLNAAIKGDSTFLTTIEINVIDSSKENGQ